MNPVNFNYAITDGTKFELNFNRVTRPVLQFRDECIAAAKHIHRHTDRPIMVSFSGGIDSEVACRSFLAAGIPFSVVIAAQTNGQNVFDISYAKWFCDEYKIAYNIIDFDVDKFINHHVPKYIDQGYFSSHFFRYTQLFYLETIENIGGCAVLGGGENLFNYIDDSVVISYSAGLAIGLDWVKRNNLHFPYFFFTTPEITASYLNHELVQWLLDRPEYLAQRDAAPWMSVEKPLVYHQQWPGMSVRPKLSGYEYSNDGINDLRAKLAAKFKHLEPSPVIKTISQIRVELGI